MAIQLYLTKQENSPDIVGIQILKANWLEKERNKKKKSPQKLHKAFI